MTDAIKPRWVNVRVRRDVRQKLAEIARTVDHPPDHMADLLLRFALEKYEDAGDYETFMERWAGDDYEPGWLPAFA